MLDWAMVDLFCELARHRRERGTYVRATSGDSQAKVLRSRDAVGAADRAMTDRGKGAPTCCWARREAIGQPASGPAHKRASPRSDPATSGGREGGAFTNSLKNNGNFVNWRRGRDLNPRYGCPYAAFRVRCIRPLCHLSSRGAVLSAPLWWIASSGEMGRRQVGSRGLWGGVHHAVRARMGGGREGRGAETGPELGLPAAESRGVPPEFGPGVARNVPLPKSHFCGRATGPDAAL